MQYYILKSKENNEDWKTLDVRSLDGQELYGCSINRKNKDGTISFKDADGNDAFDKMVEGYTFDGNEWRGPKGWYIFGPKPRPASAQRATGASIAKAQEVKASNIKEAQERTSHAVKIAAAMRDSTLIMVNHPEFKEMDATEWQAFHKRIKDWYLAAWKQTEKDLDLPF